MERLCEESLLVEMEGRRRLLQGLGGARDAQVADENRDRLKGRGMLLSGCG